MDRADLEARGNVSLADKPCPACGAPACWAVRWCPACGAELPPPAELRPPVPLVAAAELRFQSERMRHQDGRPRCVGQTAGFALRYADGSRVVCLGFLVRLADTIAARAERQRFLAYELRVRRGAPLRWSHPAFSQIVPVGPVTT